jgi:hypothetical protein
MEYMGMSWNVEYTDEFGEWWNGLGNSERWVGRISEA